MAHQLTIIITISETDAEGGTLTEKEVRRLAREIKSDFESESQGLLTVRTRYRHITKENN